MRRIARIGTATFALVLTLAGCGAAAKDTGLPSSPTPEPEKGTLVKVIDSAFEPATVTVKPGDTVKWKFVGAAPHNVKFLKLPVNSHPSCTPSGGCGAAGDVFTKAFDKPGNYLYYCVIHGSPGGPGMVGHLVVKA
ncbi:MAG: hypothetical protein NVSMB57_12910 [Actinomycetota bacterium]